MIAFSKRVEYGLMALFHMDEEGQDVLVSRRQIADAYHIPLELAGKVLQDLKRAGFIHSIQGARGGYRLEQNLEDISLGDLMTALDGPILSVKCVGTGASNCKNAAACNIRHFAKRVGVQLQHFYHTISLKDVANGKHATGGSHA